MGLFKSTELAGTIGPKQREALPRFCKAMCAALGELVRQLSPTVTPRGISELRLLNLGSQFQGANNVTIGKQAAADVFLAIADILRDHAAERTERKLLVRNSAGRLVTVALAADPDVRIQVEENGTLRNKMAIKIKGGTDSSNAHNRAGEAEKSHQKAKKVDFRDFWTIIALEGLDAARLREESPTTNSWFDIAQDSAARVEIGRSSDQESRMLLACRCGSCDVLSRGVTASSNLALKPRIREGRDFHACD